MKWAVTKGLFDNMTVSPNGKISRENIAIVINRYLKAVNVKCPTTAVSKPFADEAAVSANAKTSLHILYDIGIFKGIGGNQIAPKNTTTRCEFAALAHRLAAYMN